MVDAAEDRVLAAVTVADVAEVVADEAVAAVADATTKQNPQIAIGWANRSIEGSPLRFFLCA